MVCLRFQLAKQLNLVAHLSAGMQNLKSRPEFSGRSVISLGGELGHLAQPNCRKKKQNKPRAAADAPGGVTPKQQAMHVIARTVSAAILQPPYGELGRDARANTSSDEIT